MLAPRDILNKITGFFRRPVVITMQAGTGVSVGNTYGNGAKWPSGLSRPAPINIHDGYSLRQQARDAMYDSTVCRSIVERYADTVVDTGLKVKPTPLAELLGITEEAAEQWAESVRLRFHLWAKSKKSHRSRVNNLYQNQHLYQKFQQRDNDIFVRFYYGRDWDSISPLQYDFIDPNQIRGVDYTSSYAQTPGDDGITRDSAGREISYKIWNIEKDGKYKETTIPAVGEKSGRIMMLHGFNPEYAGQGRGYSRLAHAIQEFENLTDFTASTIKKAIAQSSLSMATENDIQDAGNPMEGRAVSVGQYGSLETQAETTGAQGSSEPIANYTAIPEATFREPGSVGIFNLRRGDKLKYLQDTSPGAQYEAFVNNFCAYLCASMGIPLEVLLMKFSNNYSASRACLILFWRVAQIWRNEMVSDFLDPLYESWLSEEIAAGRITAPGWSDPLLRAAWLNCEWSGAPMPNIDPQKSFEADKGYISICAQTLDDVAQNLNGSSGKANRAKNARQFSELPEPPWNNKPEQAVDKQQDDAAND